MSVGITLYSRQQTGKRREVEKGRGDWEEKEGTAPLVLLPPLPSPAIYACQADYLISKDMVSQVILIGLHVRTTWISRCNSVQRMLILINWCEM